MKVDGMSSYIGVGRGRSQVASGLLSQWTASRKSDYRHIERVKQLLRSLRALLYPHDHRILLGQDVYRRFIAVESAAELFHHLGNKHYLSKRLSWLQRTRFSLSHARIDSVRFGEVYKSALYSGKGLDLWHRRINEVDFLVRLYRGSRRIPEGDLCVSLMANEKRLHSISFNWLDATLSVGSETITPFVTRSQGRWRKDSEPLEQFEAAFPQNSPSYFCYAAMQGIARAVGAKQVLAIRSIDQLCHTPEDASRLRTSYDEFWGNLGGVDTHWLGHVIPVPFHMRPITEVPSKHRKRALMRRAHWQAIDDEVYAGLVPHVLPTRPEPA